MTRGIRQGCPIFALLFLFVTEILSIKIKIEPNINLNYVLQLSETNLNALDRNFRFSTNKLKAHLTNVNKGVTSITYYLMIF